MDKDNIVPLRRPMCQNCKKLKEELDRVYYANECLNRQLAAYDHLRSFIEWVVSERAE